MRTEGERYYEVKRKSSEERGAGTPAGHPAEERTPPRVPAEFAHQGEIAPGSSEWASF